MQFAESADCGPAPRCRLVPLPPRLVRSCGKGCSDPPSVWRNGIIAAELRGTNRPNLTEALGWIGSRVDDIYGSSLGRLEDVWIDPGTGVPRWLLIKEGHFGGRTTLIPFEDATAGAGHVWVPYEHDVVRQAPEVQPGVPLTQQVEARLRAHFAASTAAAVPHSQQQTPAANRGIDIPRARKLADHQEPPYSPEQPKPHFQQPTVRQPQPTLQPPPAHQPHPQQPSPTSMRPPAAAGWPPAPADDQQAPTHQYAPPPPPPAPFPQVSRSAPPGGTQAQTRFHPPEQPPATAAPEQIYRPPAPRSQPGDAAPMPAPQPPLEAVPPARPPLAPVAQPDPEQAQPAPGPSPAPDSDAQRVLGLPLLGELDRPYRVEVRFKGEISVSGELSGLSIAPLDDEPR